MDQDEKYWANRRKAEEAHEQSIELDALRKEVGELREALTQLWATVSMNAYNARDEVDAMTAVLDRSVGQAVWEARRNR